jgi:hypothetical protein
MHCNDPSFHVFLKSNLNAFDSLSPHSATVSDQLTAPSSVHLSVLLPNPEIRRRGP